MNITREEKGLGVTLTSIILYTSNDNFTSNVVGFVMRLEFLSVNIVIFNTVAFMKGKAKTFLTLLLGLSHEICSIDDSTSKMRRVVNLDPNNTTLRKT